MPDKETQIMSEPIEGGDSRLSSEAQLALAEVSEAIEDHLGGRGWGPGSISTTIINLKHVATDAEQAEIFARPDLNDLIEKCLAKALGGGYLKEAKVLLDLWPEGAALIGRDRVRQAAEKYIVSNRRSEEGEPSHRAAEIFQIPPERVAEIIRTAVIADIGDGMSAAVLRVLDYFDISREILAQPEGIRAIKTGLRHYLPAGTQGGEVRNEPAHEFLVELELPEAFYQESVRETALACIEKGFVRQAEKYNAELSEPLDLTTPAIQGRAKKGFLSQLSRGEKDRETTTSIALFCPDGAAFVASESVRKAARAGILASLGAGSASRAEQIRDQYHINLADIDSTLLYQAAQIGCLAALKGQDISGAVTISKEFGLRLEDWRREEVVAALRTALIDTIRRESHYRLPPTSDLINICCLSREQLTEIARSGLIRIVRGDHIDYATGILRYLGVSTTEVLDDDLRAAAAEGFAYCIEKKNYPNAKKQAEIFELSPDQIKSKLAGQVVKQLPSHGPDDLARLIRAFEIGPDVLTSRTVIEAAIPYFVRELPNGYFWDLDTLNLLGRPTEIIDDPKVRAAAFAGLVSDQQRHLGVNNHKTADRICEAMSFSPETILEATRQAFVARMAEGHRDAILVLDSLQLDQAQREELIREGLIAFLAGGHSVATPMESLYGVTAETYADPELRAAALRGIPVAMADHELHEAGIMVEKFHFTPAEIGPAAAIGVTALLKEGSGDAVKAVEHLDLNRTLFAKEWEAAAVIGVIKCLRQGSTRDAIEIAKAFIMEPNPAVEEAFVEALIAKLEHPNYELDEMFQYFRDSHQSKDRTAIFARPETFAAVKDGLIKHFHENGDPESLLDTMAEIPLSTELRLELNKEVARAMLIDGNENFDVFMSAVESLGLPEEFFREPKTVDCVNKLLAKIIERRDEYYVYGVGRLREVAHLDAERIRPLLEDPKQSVQSKLQLCCVFAGCFDEYLAELYPRFVDALEPQVKENYDFLAELIGPIKLRSICSENINFATNPHDYLLFVERIRSLPREKQKLIDEIVLRNCLNRLTETARLGVSLGSFDIDIYLAKCDGEVRPFRNLAEFVREAELQKHNIHVPEEASEEFKEAIGHLIGVSGVDVPFLRTMIDLYIQDRPVRPVKAPKPVVVAAVPDDESTPDETAPEEPTPAEDPYWQYDEDWSDNEPPEVQRPVPAAAEHHTADDDEIDDGGNGWEDHDSSHRDEFAHRLIAVIEGIDDIDQRKLIKPWSETFPLDPLYKIVYNAFGIHSLNQYTPRYAQYLAPSEKLNDLCHLLGRFDQDRIAAIEKSYEARIAKDPARRDRLAAERKREVQKARFVILGSGNQPDRINLGEVSELQFRFDNTETAEIGQAVSEIFDDAAFRALLIAHVLDFEAKKTQIMDTIDLAQFASLVPAMEHLSSMYSERKSRFEALVEHAGDGEISKEQKAMIREQAIRNFSGEELSDIFAGQEATVAAFVLYFALNNRKRQQESRSLKSALDQVLRQDRYRRQHETLKSKGLVESRNDPFISYVQGKMGISAEDDERIRAILTEFGLSTSGRQLKAEIAAGDDVTAWTCGDQTDCCMPFTSSHNQEYLLRDDMSYFVVRIVSPDGSEEIVAQSVLVAGSIEKDPTKYAIALDNIEVANRALHLRPIIIEAYRRLKDHLIMKYEGDLSGRLRLTIGTSYNDDGGMITGQLDLEPRLATPSRGEMIYSDWAHHNVEYRLYDSDAADETDSLRLYGLQKDLFASSRVREILTDKTEYDEVEALLETISKGEDDDEDGMTFPDNYSAVLAENNKVIGYVIAADYLAEWGSDDFVTIEKIAFAGDLPETDKSRLLGRYFQKRQFDSSNEIHGLIVSEKCLQANTWVQTLLQKMFPDARMTPQAGNLRLTFTRVPRQEEEATEETDEIEPW